MKVLSLFDGISCGRVALERAGIPVEKYYASEVDKYAEKISEANYPDIVRLGDVTKWREWDIEQPDLICAGSPCQGFSFAGKQLNFSDPRSSLFFEFVNILNHYKPKYFLLENVKMKKEYQDIISKLVGCEPVEINSCLVSAQNRKRLYWTNIPEIQQPVDKGIVLRDIVFPEVSQDNTVMIIQKGRGNNPGGIRAINGKTPCLSSSSWEHNNHIIEIEYGKNYVQYDLSGKGHRSQDQRAFYMDKKHGCLPANGAGSKAKVLIGDMIRKLIPVEFERLQTLPDGYTGHVSNTQRYKAIGNGWTVDVIAHIFKNMK